MDLCGGTPSRFLNFRALYVLLCEGCDFGFQIVAHEIEVLAVVLIRWVDGGFGGRQGEDQPSVTCIDGLALEDVAEEGPVRFSVFAVENYVSAGNRFALLSKTLIVVIILFGFAVLYEQLRGDRGVSFGVLP